MLWRPLRDKKGRFRRDTRVSDCQAIIYKLQPKKRRYLVAMWMILEIEGLDYKLLADELGNTPFTEVVDDKQTVVGMGSKTFKERRNFREVIPENAGIDISDYR